MKNIFILILLPVLFFTTAQAQINRPLDVTQQRLISKAEIIKTFWQNPAEVRSNDSTVYFWRNDTMAYSQSAVNENKTLQEASKEIDSLFIYDRKFNQLSEKIRFTYNAEGQMLSAISELQFGFRGSIYSYHPNSRISIDSSYYLSGGIIVRKVLKYDTSGSLVFQNIFQESGGAIPTFDSTQTIYFDLDANNRIVKSMRTSTFPYAPTGQRQLEHISYFQYNSSMLVAAKDSSVINRYNDAGTSIISTKKIVVIHNFDQGVVVSSNTTENGQDKEKMLYMYSGQNLTSTENFIWSETDTTWNLKEISKFHYDTTGIIDTISKFYTGKYLIDMGETGSIDSAALYMNFQQVDDVNSFQNLNSSVSSGYRMLSGVMVLRSLNQINYHYQEVQIPTNIVDQKFKESLLIYPNPVVSHFYLTSSADDQSIAIFDLKGSLVFHKNLTKGLNQIDFSFAETGNYFIIVRNRKGEFIGKQIIKR